MKLLSSNPITRTIIPTRSYAELNVKLAVTACPPPDWRLRSRMNCVPSLLPHRTKAIVINTPNNPTGKVFSREELTYIASLCEEFDALAITDEIYEHITYDGLHHIPIATICPGTCASAPFLINSLSKTFSVTGWRVGWVIAPPEITNTVRKVHDFLTVGAATPLQHAGIMALGLPDSYFNGLAAEYDGRRQAAIAMLEGAGFRCYVPGGAYYVMCDIRNFGPMNDVVFAQDPPRMRARRLAGVPGSSFYLNPASGSSQQKDLLLQEI